MFELLPSILRGVSGTRRVRVWGRAAGAARAPENSGEGLNQRKPRHRKQ